MKKILTLICTLLCANVLLAQTYDGAFYVEDLIYAYNNSDQTAVVYGYRDENPPTDLVIPSAVAYQGTTYDVTTIASGAFGRTYYAGSWSEIDCTTLTSVTIPNSVTSIGSEAFRACSSLTSVTIGNSVTYIGVYAFFECSNLTSVTIGNSVTSIGMYAFHGCSSLTNLNYNAINYNNFDSYYHPFNNCPISTINIGDSVQIIPNFFAYNLDSLTSITIPNSVTSIGWNAFENCSSLTSVTIGNSVTSIGDYAFENCSSLTSVTIGNSVTSIGEDAFDGCSSLTNLNYNAINCNYFNSYYYPFNNCPISIINIGDSVQIIPDFFAYNLDSLTSITIPNSVTSIGEHAFRACSSLTSVTIPNSVTSIGSSAFDGCSSLTSVTIGNSVTSIGGSAFSGCSSLTSITIPNSVTYIGGGVFCNCSSLTSIDIPNSVTSIESSAFGGCSSLTSITIPNSVTSIGSDAFSGCSSLTSITIPNSVTSIGYGVFWGCSSLTSITIPNSVTSIGGGVFYNCSSLTSVTLSNNITELPSYNYNIYYGFFENCSSLTSITIPNSVTSIGSSAFRACSSLTSITIPNSVTSIGSDAFSGCSSLTSITIPNSVTSIGSDAFSGCSSLTSITIPDSVTSIGYSAFSDCSSLTSVTIPNSVTSIGGGVFYNCSSLTSVTLSNNITELPSYNYYNYPTITCYGFFENCSSLTSITIPNSVTSIGTSAFSSCSSLTSVTCLRSNSPSLGSGVFAGTPNNKTLTIPCGYESEYTDWQNATTWASIDCIVIIGSRFTIGDLTYEVTSEAEVKVQDCTESATSVVIPSTITYQGTTYSVTSIGNSAFFECSNLTSVTIPNSVTSIASGTFNDCSFLQNVTCLATNPPTLEDNTVFPYPNIASLKVPCGTLEAYSAPTSFWNMFFAGRISENGYNVEVSVNDETFGSVAVESDCYTGTLTATANEGYVFLSWNDGNTENPRVVSLTSDTSFVANFIISTVNTDITATICQGQTYTENGFNVSEAGTYTQTLTAINGADSIVTLTLNVNPIYNTDLVASICDGEVYNENGFNVNEAGVYTQTLQALNGCDSIVTLTLSVNPVFNTNLSAFICEGETYTENGFNVSEAGVYTQSLQSVNGCDSIVTLTLNVNPIFHTELSATICEGSVYNDNGFNVSEAGTYTQNLTTANGCDSIVTLALTVLPSYNTNLTATICEGSELNISGFHVTEGGVYTQTYTAVNGCDSIVTLTVTELPTIHTNLTLTICEGTSLNFSGFNVSEAGVYTQTYTAVNGCDSIVTLTVTELPIIHTDLTLTICEGTSLNFSGFNVSEAGIYTQNLTSVNGCDSIVTLTVSVNPVFDTTINATINPGETYAEFGFNESESGTYVQNLQTEAGCDSTITLNLTVNSSLYDVAEFAELSVYPNPTSGKVTFSKEIEKIEVIDLSGKTLQTYENANEINIEALPAGVYHLRMTIGDKTTTRKVIKE